jgi:Tol biopolymer transport system component
VKRATALTIVMAAAFFQGVTAAAVEVGGGPRQRWDCVAFEYLGDIFVINLDGTGLARLTAGDGADHFSPAFSPDGTKIAFTAGRESVTAVYVMNVDGTDKRRLSPPNDVPDRNEPCGDAVPVFAPDGDRVAATRAINGGRDIVFFPTSGGAEELFSKKIEDAWKRERRPIPAGPPLWADIWGPAFSADGQSIAYRLKADNCGDSWGSWLCIARADGSAAQLLAEGLAYSYALSPDGKKLAFDEWTEEGWLFCVINSDGTERRQLAEGDHDEAPAFSPDGEKILYCVPRRSETPDDIFIMNADGSERRALTRTPMFECGAQFTPDGSKIVFNASPVSYDDTAEPGIYVMNADGSGRRFLVAGEDFSLGPSLVEGRLLDSYGNRHDVVEDPEATPGE